VLLEVEGIQRDYEIVLERREGMDEATVRVEAAAPDDASLRATVERRLAAALGVPVGVELVATRTLARSEGKARRVVDLRRPA
jgi:phenylacetate-CoA ligase